MSEASTSRKRADSLTKEGKKRKISVACTYCRRSHMNCSSDRPCERCIRRGISELCRLDGEAQAQHPPSPPGPSSFNEPQPTLANKNPTVSRPPLPSVPAGRSSGSSASSYDSYDSASSTSSSHPPPAPSAPFPSFFYQPPSQHHNLELSASHHQPPPSSLPLQPPIQQQSFANPSSSSYPRRPTALAPTPLETTPIASPRGWIGMEDANGSHSVNQAGIESLAEMFGKGGDDWGNLSGFLDSLDLPVSNQPSPGRANAFSPFPSNNNPSGSSTPGFAVFQADPLDQRHSQLMSLFDAYKHRLPAHFPNPTLNLSPKPTYPQPLQPPPQAPPRASSSRHPIPLKPPPHHNHPPTASSLSHSRLNGSPYLANPSHQPPPSSSHTPQNDSFAQILRAKYESSQLAKAEEGWDWERGWAKLDNFMRENLSAASQARINAPLAIFRPAVRKILADMSSVERLLVEESFQKMLLSYDRVFTVVDATPSCFWRRTGEVFKCNAAFASLVGVHIDWFRDGKVGIYELMKEDSAVNFWEQYFQVGFDRTRKAVLTTCTLLLPPRLLVPPNARNKQFKPLTVKRRAEIACCFSFTVMRDDWGVPVGVMGNFMEI